MRIALRSSLSGSIRRWLFLMALPVMICGCSREGDGSPTGRKLPSIDLSFSFDDGRVSPPMTMEVAATDPERAKGLMFRRSLQPDHGMIFIFEREEPHSFWMRNTLIPLDMVFVSKDLRVVGFLEDVPPLTENPRSVGAPSQYVLEFSAGTVRRLGVQVGSKINIIGALPKSG